MTRVLLVTGSRSLATIPGAEEWARDLIRTALDGVDLLIVGDAPGPDAWAWGEAERAERRSGFGVCVDLGDGPLTALARAKYAVRGEDAGWIVDGEGRWTSTWTDARRPHPLNRNQYMVHDAMEMMTRGHDVRCLALLDGTKRDAPGKRATRGTEHTAGLAERAGIKVERQTWSQEMGPRDAV